MKSIGYKAFSGCSSLTSLVIGNGVTSIGRYAFEGCDSLTSVTLNAIDIKNWFSGRSSIKTIVIGDDVTSIDTYAFHDCSGLTSLVIGNSVTSIGDGAFYGCSGLTSVVIPNSVTSIGGGAFSDCSGLTSVVIPNSVTSIGYYAFRDCSSLTSIEIGDGVTSIGDGAFSGCSGLTSVEIPNSVISIGNSAFRGCSGLTSIEIPNSVTSIGEEAFSGCSGLTNLVLESAVNSIDAKAFVDSPLRTIVSRSISPIKSETPFSNYTYIHAPLYVPEGAYWNYAYAEGWGDFIHIKEMATEVSSLQSRKAYMIADTKGCNYKVYDAEKDALKTVEYTHALDEESEGCCWTVMKENGNTYLYNLGAKKFGVVGNDGAITLSETPVNVTISENEDGLSINGANCMFVLNKNIEVDVTGINDVLQNGVNTKNVQIHTLDGRSQQHLTRGINIVNGKKVLVK